jgi:hypothetical protein
MLRHLPGLRKSAQIMQVVWVSQSYLYTLQIHEDIWTLVDVVVSLPCCRANRVLSIFHDESHGIIMVSASSWFLPVIFLYSFETSSSSFFVLKKSSSLLGKYASLRVRSRNLGETPLHSCLSELYSFFLFPRLLILSRSSLYTFLCADRYHVTLAS